MQGVQEYSSVLPPYSEEAIEADKTTLVANKCIFGTGKKLKEIPSDIEEAEILYLTYNQIAQIPSRIGRSSCLLELYLSQNHLNFISFTIGNLGNLKILAIGENRLFVLPDSISYLVNLESLLVANNQLSTLPDLSRLKQLEFVNISSNQFESVPEFFFHMQGPHVDISNNLLSMKEQDEVLAKVSEEGYDGANFCL